MYKGKRRRLRKKDLHKQTTFEFGKDIHLGKYNIELVGTRRRFFSRKCTGTLGFTGFEGDSLGLIIKLTIDNKKTGEVVLKDKPFILLPEVEGRSYYWVDEEQV